MALVVGQLGKVSLMAASRLPATAVRNISVCPALMAKAKRMEQVEVDEQHVKDKLGHKSMAFVKKAEKMNAKRATKHVVFRRKDWVIGGTCFAIAIGIYGYTIYAMKQERFLDDFEMPDPLEESERK